MILQIKYKTKFWKTGPCNFKNENRSNPRTATTVIVAEDMMCLVQGLAGVKNFMKRGLWSRLIRPLKNMPLSTLLNWCKVTANSAFTGLDPNKRMKSNHQPSKHMWHMVVCFQMANLTLITIVQHVTSFLLVFYSWYIITCLTNQKQHLVVWSMRKAMWLKTENIFEGNRQKIAAEKDWPSFPFQPFA